MANISDAYGVIKLVGDWTNEMCEALNKMKKRWESWHYNIMINGEFSPNEPEQSFNGAGRWAFKSNIESLDSWMRSDFPDDELLADSYSFLVSEMEKLRCGIQFEYTDMEGGCLMLYSASDLLEAVDGHLTVTESNENNYEYCWEEYLECDYGGEEQFEELIDGILEKLNMKDGAPDELKEKIEKWAMINTLPYANAECLDEDKFLQLTNLLGINV